MSIGDGNKPVRVSFRCVVAAFVLNPFVIDMQRLSPLGFSVGYAGRHPMGSNLLILGFAISERDLFNFASV